MPAPVRRLIEKCWHRDPRRRPRFEQLDDENGEVHQLRALLGLRSRSVTGEVAPPRGPPVHAENLSIGAGSASGSAPGSAGGGATSRRDWIPSVDERTGKMYYYDPKSGKAVWEKHKSGYSGAV